MKVSVRIGAFWMSEDEVRLAVVKTAGKLPSVLELHTARITTGLENPEEQFAAKVEAVNEVISKVKHPPVTYVLAATSEWSIVRLIRIPFKGQRRVAAAVQFELEPYLAFPIDDLAVDYVPVRTIEGQTEVLAVGLRKAQLFEQLSVFEAAEIRIDGAGVDAVGQTGLWQYTRKNPAGLHAVLHVRQKNAILAILYGKSLAYFRHLPQTASELESNPVATAREVHNLLRAFLSLWTAKVTDKESKAQRDIESLTVLGANFFEEERSLFENQFDFPVAYDDLFGKVKWADTAYGKLKESSPRPAEDEGEPEASFSESADQNTWLGIIGVADGAAGGANTMDFLKGELRPERTLKGVSKHIAVSAAMALVAFGGWIAYVAMDYRKNVEAVERIGEQIHQEFQNAFPEHEAAQKRPSQDIGGIRTFAIMSEEMEKGAGAAETLSVEMFNRPTLLEMLNEVARIMPDSKVSITDKRVEFGRRSEVTISGEVKELADFDEVFAKFQQSELFQDATVQRRAVGGVETFVIRATI